MTIPTIDDTINLPAMGCPKISPDGKQIAYIATSPDWKENAYVDQIWLIEAEGEPRRLTFNASSSFGVEWAPNGAWLGFLSKRNGDEQTQLYRMCASGGEAERLTTHGTEIQQFAFSPDGAKLAFIAPLPESRRAKERKEKYGDYQVDDQDSTYSHLWWVNLEDRKVTQVTGGDSLHVVEFDWHPAGTHLAFTAWPTPDAKNVLRSKVFMVDLSTFDIVTLAEEASVKPRWSPDGSHCAYSRTDLDGFHHNYRIEIVHREGGEPRMLGAHFDESAHLIRWGEEGLYFSAMQRTSIHLFRINPATDEIEKITPSVNACIHSASFNRDSTKAAVIFSDSATLSEVALLDVRAKSLQPLTHNNDVTQDWDVGTTEVIEWTSEDGVQIEGILTKPTNFDPRRKYPLLLVIHGGPVGTALPVKLSMNERRQYPIRQWVENQGALVLQPNYRGSAGYGAEFRGLNVRDLGVGDSRDVLSGVDYMIAQGVVDAGRLGVMGWSQGGYISAFLATHSNRFKAVSVGAGVSNWMTYYVNTDIHAFTRAYLQATPWEDEDIYRKTSPMTNIMHASTPTLIQHGELDRRVPIANAYELYQGLQDMGVESRLTIYQGMAHGINKPRQTRRVMEENYEWFNRFLWNDTPREAGGILYVDLPIGEVKNTSMEARWDGADYRMFSGKLGLITEIVHGTEHWLKADKVSELAATTAIQLHKMRAKTMVVYSGSPQETPDILIYLGCLQVAAGIVGKISVEHRVIS